MKLSGEKIVVQIDENNGCVTDIVNKNDFAMNWVRDNANWGKIDNFKLESVTKSSDAFSARYSYEPDKHYFKRKDDISITVEKKLINDIYQERYVLTNHTNSEFFINQETFGIHFPFNSIYQGDKPVCMAHVWAGADVCWLVAKKIADKKELLVIRLTEGSISDYGIYREILGVKEDSTNFRGDIVLHPTPCSVSAGESVAYTFLYDFTNKNEIDYLEEQDGFISVKADCLTHYIHETVTVSAKYNGQIDTYKILVDGEEQPCVLQDNRIVCRYKADTLGEKKFDVYINGKHTYLIANAILPIEKILEKRAYFIAENQQFHKEGSPLDGAYLIYDNQTKSQYYSHSYDDYNAGRERIVMGCIVLKQLQARYDEKLMQSIKKHRAFIERELFDSQTATVYNKEGRNNDWRRIYNDPWFALYFLEWYLLTNDKTHLAYAGKVMLNYYEDDKNHQDSQLIHIPRLCAYLEKENLLELKDKLIACFMEYIDGQIDNNGKIYSEEICVLSHEPFNNKSVYFSHAYQLKKDEKFLAYADVYKNYSQSYYSYQPDYHMNMISTRYWDDFWFGKYRLYGDSYPHYWSVQTGILFAEYEKAFGVDCKAEYENIFKNNLCVYSPNGGAFNNYLYPYKIVITDNEQANYLRPKGGAYYGKKYEAFANDQDWSLYLASYYLAE